ncbi:MAG: hypothetical protein DI526_05725 [Caulobacter segnis]|uniref:Uncharacterized protein n=1 Tax=Caulobacter segnis TaxID=88688 RepID=A0A2W5VGN6_9CAUL|nr:MAG: hypothetical protein DI526_05725 [Caulobacter segnis]
MQWREPVGAYGRGLAVTFSLAVIAAGSYLAALAVVGVGHTVGQWVTGGGLGDVPRYVTGSLAVLIGLPLAGRFWPSQGGH